jgi:hypothetical protein
MVHILDTLTRLENKFDTLSLNSGLLPHENVTPVRQSTGHTPSSLSPNTNTGVNREQEDGLQFPTELQKPYDHLTVPHKVLLWPSIYIHIINTGIKSGSDLQYILQEGTAWFIQQEMGKHPDTLPCDVGLPSFALNNSLREQGYSSNVAFPTLTIQNIHEQCDAYFNTFNIIFPVLNREPFMNEIVAPLLRNGYGDGDPHSVLALLVFAIGQVAIEGVFERPISVNNGQPSGFRGGTADRPPAIAIFNEARRRLGFIMTSNTLETVQIQLLQGMYFEAHARHLDFWRCIVSASMVCQVLINCRPIEWTTPMGDLIKRAYWTCALCEDLYHLDLDLPKTGILLLQDDVPLPYFHESQPTQPANSPLSDDPSHFGYHFLAMIALRRLIARINTAIHNSKLFCERKVLGRC